MAQVVSEGHMAYRIGTLRFLETPRHLAIFKGSALIGTSAIRAGGIFDPPIRVSPTGILTIGTHAFDVQTGRPLKVQASSPCDKRLSLNVTAWRAARKDQMLELQPLVDTSQRTIAYRSRLLNLGTCKVLAQSMIRHDNVDYFFEFGASTSGWWLVGPDEGSVLINSSGRRWQKLRVPQGIANVLTALWQENGTLWLLANRPEGTNITPTLYETSDLGESWRTVEGKVSNLPAYWFEAIRELSTAPQ
jgi:hypothetical protein